MRSICCYNITGVQLLFLRCKLIFRSIFFFFDFVSGISKLYNFPMINLLFTGRSLIDLQIVQRRTQNLDEHMRQSIQEWTK